MARIGNAGRRRSRDTATREPAGRVIAMRDGERATSLRRLLTACVCGALLALPVAAAAQQAQDDDEDTFEQKIIKNILGGMGVDVGRPGIDYRERSPLVIPPSLDLPPPQAAGTMASNPAWPREPERKVTVRKTKNTRATPDEPGSESALTPDELKRGINPRAPRVTDPSQNIGSVEDYNLTKGQMSPQELKSQSIFSWDGLMGTHLKQEGKFEREPARNALTQPPAGYQTPSTNYPYAAGTDKGSGWKIPTILDRPVGIE
jgi:hypothetical protein